MPMTNRYDECQNQERISLHLFTILNTILKEQSVTRASVQLNMSQSSVSAALARLRNLYGDPLLVRGKSRLVPTERAQEMMPSLATIGECVDLMTARSIGRSEVIVPRKCTVSCVDEISTFLIPVITAEVLASSERISIEFRSMISFDVFVELDAGRLDTAIVSGFGAAPAGHELVGTDDIVCMMSKRHPLARHESLTRAQYKRSEHVALNSHLWSRRSTFDQILQDCGIRRRNSVTLPFADVIPHLLQRSDLLFTTSRKFAAYYATLLPLHTATLEADLPTIQYFQTSTYATKDPLRVAWVASKVRSACGTGFEEARIADD
ncbi:LysR family transcriptional regulator [Caballeronia hypogeia]|uniref:LysR family transcriptional regulator n=2 Tax=Caballeronia hypogeia TaxID=1777140 RepID=A0A158CBE1_9BURK|nr:LysR family transcriptional regulator [Caballeronia hypogeia]